MFNMPVSEIKEKLAEKSGLSSEEIEKKIKEKLSQLSGLISEEGAAHIVANELGVKLLDKSNLKIKNINAGMRNVDIVGKVKQVYEIREFQKETRSGKVGNFIIADETGTLRVVLWNDQADKLKEIKQGDVIKLQSGYSRENQGRTEIHLNDLSKLLINPEGVTVDVDINATPALAESTRKKLRDLGDNDENVEVLATVVQVYDPRYYEICPNCNKRVRNTEGKFNCGEHGAVEPKYAYLLNAYLDDGTGNIRSVFFRDQALTLLGIDDAAMQEFRQNGAAFETPKNDLLGSIIKVRGRVNVNATFNSKDFVVSQIDRNPDPEAEIVENPKPKEEELYSLEELEEATK